MTTGQSEAPAKRTGSGSVRRSLGRQLKKLRLQARKSPADVELSGIAGPSKLRRVEAGLVPVKVADVWAFCRLYGADSETTDRLADLAKNTNQKGWWEDFTDIMPPWFTTYVEFEAAASAAFMFDPDLVPGLLQSPTYQRAVFETYPEPTTEFVERQLRMRSERQRNTLERRPPIELTVVVTEGALVRLVGGKPGIQEQKAHLLCRSSEPNVQLYVLPAAAGAHPATKGAFNILEFAEPDDPSLVYLETYVGGRYTEDEKIVRDFRQMSETIRSMSVTIEEHLQ